MIRCAPRSRATSNASSRSVASLSAGCRSTTAPAARAAFDRGGIGGVEVADDVVDVQPERLGLMQARVGGDDDRVVGQQCVAGAASTGSPPASTMAARVTRIPPSAGITRSRFEGSVAGRVVRMPPSQPGVPRAPRGCVVVGLPRATTRRGLRSVSREHERDRSGRRPSRGSRASSRRRTATIAAVAGRDPVAAAVGRHEHPRARRRSSRSRRCRRSRARHRSAKMWPSWRHHPVALARRGALHRRRPATRACVPPSEP